MAAIDACLFHSDMSVTAFPSCRHLDVRSAQLLPFPAGIQSSVLGRLSQLWLAAHPAACQEWEQLCVQSGSAQLDHEPVPEGLHRVIFVQPFPAQHLFPSLPCSTALLCSAGPCTKSTHEGWVPVALDADGIPSAGIEMEIVSSCESGNGGCSHLCHHSSAGPICTCNSGYQLQDDQRTCTGKTRLTPRFHKSIPSQEDPHVSATVCIYTMRL